MSALKVSKLPFFVLGGEVRMVKGNGKSQSLGVNMKCCQTRGRERGGTAEDFYGYCGLSHGIIWVGRHL